MTYWHYTCKDSAAKIGPAGKIKPGGSHYAWFTDMAHPNRDALGLTMNYIDCDRTTHRYRVVEDALLVRWLEVRRSEDWDWVRLLEHSPGARPMHWWVSEDPVGVIYDPVGGER